MKYYASPPPSQPSTSLSSHFKPVELTPTRLDQFHDIGHSSLAQTIQAYVKLGRDPIDGTRWRFLRSRGGVNVYSDRRAARLHVSSLLVAGTVRAHLADVMEGLYMDTSQDTRRVYHQLSPRFMDAEVLKVVEQRSLDRPYAFTGLKWAMLKSASRTIVSNRDVCFFEKLGTINIAGGRKLGYFLMQSVDLPECPPLRSRKVVRADISLCYLFEELQDGIVGVYMKGNMESYGPQVLWKMARKSFADIALSMSDVVDITYMKRSTRLVEAKRLRALARPKRGIVCEVCRVLPSFYEHHSECAGCNKLSVCKKCRTKCDVFATDNDPRRVKPVTFCVDCVERVRSPPRLTPIPQKATPRRQQPPVRHENGHLARAHEREATCDERVRFPVVELDSYANSFHTVNEDDSSDEHLPESQRSLREFSLKIAQQLESTGYNDSDTCLRLTELASLGTGAVLRHATATVESADPRSIGFEATSDCKSAASSEYSISDAECDGDDDDLEGYDTDEEEIVSIRPLRRSTQPPEMLERQMLARDGSVRYRSHTQSSSAETSPTIESEHAKMLSRLMQASIAAEETLRLTNENSRRVNRMFSTSRSRAPHC